MGSPPRSILRWGTTVISAVFILFFVFAWIIRYPDLIPSPVEITTENPPVIMVSKITGKIKHLYVTDEEVAKPGQILAVMETAASLPDIVALKNFVDTIEYLSPVSLGIVPDLNGLGELQNSFSTFRKSFDDLSGYVRRDFYGSRINSTRAELSGLRIYSGQLRENERLISENLQLELRSFRRDSLLRSGKTIPDAEYEKSRQELNRQRINLQTVRLEISAKKIEEINKEQLIKEYSIKRDEELDILTSTMEEAFRNLRAQLRIWENNYLLVSPLSGRVAFTKFWKENQTVSEGEQVLSIVPLDQGDFIGRISLGMLRSGKVDTGQMVYIKLSSFPYLEFGMVPGRVKTKSLVPAGNAYVIEIELPDGLTTLYGKKLIFTQNMQGTAEIITDDRTLLARIVSPFRHLLSFNKKE